MLVNTPKFNIFKFNSFKSNLLKSQKLKISKNLHIIYLFIVNYLLFINNLLQ